MGNAAACWGRGSPGSVDVAARPNGKAERHHAQSAFLGIHVTSCKLPLALIVLLLGFFSAFVRAERLTESDFQQIAALMERGQLREAEAKLQEGLKADPDSVLAHRLLGVLYQREGNFPQAEGTLERAAQLSHRKDPQTLFALCQTKFALKKTHEALDLAAQVSALAENDPRARYALGRLLRDSSFPEQAARELEKARALAPQNPAITTELIAAYLDEKRREEAEGLLQPLINTASYDDLIQAGSRFGEAGQFAAAVRALERATQIRPGSYDAQFDLAFALYRRGDYPQALETLDRISRSQAEAQRDYHYLRGKIELALQHTQAAGEQFLQAVEQQPENESLCVDAGLLFFQHENFWRALEVFELCGRHLPESVAIETGLGLTYFRLGKYDDALGAFRKVLALQPEADAAREGLAFLLYVSGNPAEARQTLEQRLGGPDADYYIYYLHALVLLRLEARSNRAVALHSLDEALRRNPRFAPAFFQRGKIWADQGEVTRALADFETATRLDPNYAQPYYPIAQIYHKLGKKREAEQARLRFASLNHEQEEKEQKRQVENRLFQSLQ